MSKKEIDLRIKNYSVKDPVIKIHSNIPSIPFNLIIYGRSNCGKTNLLVNLLKHYKKYFKDRLIIFTKSRSGTLYKIVEKLNGEVFNDLYNDEGENIIQNLLNYQKFQKSNGETLDNYCILLDDFIVDNSFNNRRSIYDTLFSQSRHYNVSVIITTQQYTLIPSSLRRMSWYDIIYRISNQTEKKLMIYEQCSSVNMTEEEFEGIYNEATNGQYNFLYLDKQKEKYQTNFGV